MSTLKGRIAGGWEDTPLAGAARIGGVSVPFGPDGGGPTYESIDWISPPSLTNGDDGADYNMGCSFTVSEDGVSCVGIEWRVPDTPSPPTGGVYRVSLWTFSPDLRVRMQAFTPVASANQQILFDEGAYALNTGVTYIACVHTRTYTFRSAASVGGFPFSVPSGRLAAVIGKLGTAGVDDPPASDFSSIYYVSPLLAV